MDTTELARRLKQIEDCEDISQQEQAFNDLNSELIPDGLVLCVDEDDQFSVKRADWKS